MTILEASIVTRRRVRAATFATAALAALAACDSAAPAPGSGGPDAAGASPAAVKLSNDATLGAYLSDGSGKTLYYFGKDLPASGAAAAASNCKGTCATTWPPFHAELTKVGDGLTAGDFGEITRVDGGKQTTYKGWPLYYYSADTAPGAITGDDVGHVWFVLRSPFYGVLMMSSIATGGPAHYLADPAGRTLYMFSKDTAGTASAPPVSACTTAQCTGAWPQFATDATAVPTAIDKSLTTFQRADGHAQAAWKGHPLYYFGGDAAPGDTKGDGVGGVWSVIDPTSL